MIKRYTYAVAAALVMSLLVSGNVEAEPTALRIGTYVPAQSVGVREVIRPWMEAVVSDVGDRVAFDEYWGGALGRDARAQYDLVKYGVIDIVWALAGFTPGQFPQIQIAELPYLARTSTESSIATWRLYQAGLIDGLGDVHVIGIWTTEMANLHLLRPITSLDELRNLRIRTAGSVQADFMRMFGAAPQTMDAVEMNQALQRGTIEGVVQAWSGMRTFGSDRLTVGAYVAPSGAIPFLLIMNKKAWTRLPADVQSSMITNGGERLARRAGAAYDRLSKTIRDSIETAGRHDIYVPDADEERRNEERVRAVHKAWIEATPRGKEAYDFFTAVLNELRSGG